jgi:hypothetical protein
MSTFLALLPVGHPALSATSNALERALKANPMVSGTVPLLERTRREWAAAVEYLQDASTVVDMATVAALAPGQRKVLCHFVWCSQFGRRTDCGSEYCSHVRWSAVGSS